MLAEPVPTAKDHDKSILAEFAGLTRRQELAVLPGSTRQKLPAGGSGKIPLTIPTLPSLSKRRADRRPRPVQCFAGERLRITVSGVPSMADAKAAVLDDEADVDEDAEGASEQPKTKFALKLPP